MTYTPPLSHNHHLPSPLSHHPNLPLSSLPPPLDTPHLYPTITTFPHTLSHHHYLPTPFPFISLCPALLCFFVLSPVVLCSFLCFAKLCRAVLYFVLCMFCRVVLSCMWMHLSLCIFLFRCARFVSLCMFRCVCFVDKPPMPKATVFTIDIFTVTLDSAIA